MRSQSFDSRGATSRRERLCNWLALLALLAIGIVWPGTDEWGLSGLRGGPLRSEVANLETHEPNGEGQADRCADEQRSGATGAFPGHSVTCAQWVRLPVSNGNRL